MPASPKDDATIVVPFPVARERLRPPAHIRSTLVASSIRAHRERGRFDAYLAGLEAQWRDVVVECVAGVWLPLGAGKAHYHACEALGLSTQEQVAVGREVGNRIQGTFLGTMIRAAKGVGATPWTAFSYTHRLYERLFDGGGCQVVQMGPKDAILEIAANPIVAVPYFRNGLRGMWQVALELFCKRAYLTELDQINTSCRIKMSWV